MKTVMLAGMAIPLLGLAACAEDPGESTEASVDIAQSYDAEAAADETAAEAAYSAGSGPSAAPAIPDLGSVAINLPKLAYTYDFAWRMPGEDIGKLQRRHADLCDQQGPASCQILGMRKNGEIGDDVTGELQLAVATRHARAFGALLEKEAGESGAEQISANIEAEELSKAIVDTEARLEARTALRDRLQNVLRTRKGTVRELVEAERGVAQVNEEIDQARSWLNEMRGRVAYSRVNIRYETGAAVSGDFLAPIQGALGSLGSIFGFLIAALIMLAAVLVPIGGLVIGGRAINRKFGARQTAEA